MHVKLFVFSLSVIFGVSSSDNPGFTVRVTEKGLEYVRDLALQLLREDIQHINVPDQSGEAGTIIGHVHYTVSNIRVDSASVGSLDVSLVSGAGLRVATSSVSIEMTADWEYNNGRAFIRISDHGSLDLKTTVDLSVTGTSKMEPNGQPTASVEGCQFNVQHVDVHFHGGASWLYNLFSGNVEDFIKKSMESEACSRITDSLNKNGQKAMDDLKLVQNIGDGVQLDFRLVQSPEFESSYLQSSQKGQFTFNQKPSSDFFPRALSLATDVSSRMFYMFITEAMLNSGSQVYHQAGRLKVKITPNMVPPNPFFKLDTDAIGGFLPGSTLKSQYPHMDMQLIVAITDAPKFNVCTNGIKSVFPADVTAYVIHPSGNLTDVFTLGMILNCSLGLWVNNQKETLHFGISKNVTVLHADLTVKKTIVGDFNTIGFQKILNGILPFLLKGIETDGIPLPMTSGLTFIEPRIALSKGSVVIGTDVKYELPSK